MSEDIPRAVYLTWSLADLDWLHEQAGIGPEVAGVGRPG